VVNPLRDHEILQLDRLIQTEKELNSIKEIIGKAIELKPVLVLIHERILTLLNAHDFAIYSLDSKSEQLTLFFQTQKYRLAEHIPFDRSSIEGYTASTGNVLNIADFHNNELSKVSYEHFHINYSLYDKNGNQIKQVLSVPLFHEGRVVGIVELFNKKNQDAPFLEEEVLLIDIAESIASRLLEYMVTSREFSAAPKQILALDEDKSFVADIIKTLSLYSDFYRLTAVNDGKEATDILKSSTIHLVIINMTKQDTRSFPIYTFIRRHYPNIPVILILASSNSQLIDAISSIGVYRYFVKPLDYNFFESILEVLLFKEPLDCVNESVLVAVGHKSVQGLTDRINSSKNILEMMNVLQEFIGHYFESDVSTLFIADDHRSELYTLTVNNLVPSVMRIKIDRKTVPGLCAVKRDIIFVKNLHDQREIKSIDNDLECNAGISDNIEATFSQVIAVPIIHKKDFLGTLLACWHKDKKEFSNEMQLYLNEISHVLGVALSNFKMINRQMTTKFESLIRLGLLDEKTLDKAFKEAKRSYEPIESVLMAKHKISKDDIIHSLEDFYRCEYAVFNPSLPVSHDLFRDLNKEYLIRELWVPIRKNKDVVDIVMYDPSDIIKLDRIKGLLQIKDIKIYIALTDDVINLINHCFEDGNATSPEIDPLLFEDIDIGDIEIDEDNEEGEEVSESDSFIIRYVNKIIADAVERKASDIHIEPNKKSHSTAIRFRIDGDCTLYQTMPFKHQKAVVSRIKIMSNLDITERRKPQDGKIVFKQKNQGITELRVAVIPSQKDIEDVVMRILAKGDVVVLESLGLTERNYEEFTRITSKPYGFILVVGPTGSGKTTTLHGALHHINKPEKKIWTAEDPIEITQDGIRHVQVNPRVGFDFAAAMRAFLRADPDVIMIGEMRDKETARTAVEAALTGHLVFSTLHTNSASETIARLLDMGIDPLNFGDSMLGILAQRLVKVLCPQCKTAYNPTQQEYEIIAEKYGKQYFDRLGIPFDSDLVLYRPVGCEICNGTGYKGRMGIHELLVNSNEIKSAILHQAKADDIHGLSMSQGMTTLLQDGIIKVFQGKTDFQQVIKVCIK